MAAGFQPIEAPTQQPMPKRWLGSWSAAQLGMGSGGAYMPRPTFIGEPPLIGVGNFWPGGLVSPNPWDTQDFDTNTFLDSIPDVTGSVQNAIDACEAGGGGIVWLPAGLVRINGISIPNGGVWLRGTGWEEYQATSTGGTYTPARRGKRGTYVLTDSTATWAVEIGAAANNVRVSDIAFLQVHPAPSSTWAPRVYPPTVKLDPSTVQGGGMIQFDHLMFWGCYRGINLGTSIYGASTTITPNASSDWRIGRVTMRDISFATFSYGLFSPNSADLITLDAMNVCPQVMTGSSDITAYMQANAAGISLAGAGRPVVTNVAAQGVAFAFSFSGGQSTAYTDRSKVIGLDVKNCKYGFYLSGLYNNVSVDGYTFVGSTSVTPGYAFYTDGGLNRADINNFHGTIFGSYAMAFGVTIILASNDDVRLGPNMWFDRYGLTSGAGAIFASSGCAVYYSNATRFTGSTGSPTTGAGTFTLY